MQPTITGLIILVFRVACFVLRQDATFVTEHATRNTDYSFLNAPNRSPRNAYLVASQVHKSPFPQTAASVNASEIYGNWPEDESSAGKTATAAARTPKPSPTPSNKPCSLNTSRCNSRRRKPTAV